ncbi:DUF3306 domain-containing protein [Aestuariicella hydrocarbonica]|uniref:DUF3306 domain-containing protein n=1 Tax=Pseudomaricurvus hydrocarbonicus TaxID=1470433 RepID=A0A9E5MP32_9GAMM|nr:DUF3306 domain-containing protein [Aestuariicella hydrocarbonica]NHO67707.1 DUF3306 domain-containing protein [Aestuariicella hydrocarbonica]
MAESRLQRWSRAKNEARQQTESGPPAAIEPRPTPEEQELAINEALPEHETLAKYNLPAPDTIELGTDIKGFMRQEIPEYLRRKALHALWKSNPVLAVLDGLNDYDEDFSGAASASRGLQTLYKVGQGYTDKTAAADEHTEVHLAGQTGSVAPAVATSVSPPVATSVSPPVAASAPPEDDNDVTHRSKSETEIDSPANRRPFELVPHQTERQPAPRYRPRMRFD